MRVSHRPRSGRPSNRTDARRKQPPATGASVNALRHTPTGPAPAGEASVRREREMKRLALTGGLASPRAFLGLIDRWAAVRLSAPGGGASGPDDRELEIKAAARPSPAKRRLGSAALPPIVTPNLGSGDGGLLAQLRALLESHYQDRWLLGPDGVSYQVLSIKEIPPPLWPEFLRTCLTPELPGLVPPQVAACLTRPTVVLDGLGTGLHVYFSGDADSFREKLFEKPPPITDVPRLIARRIYAPAVGEEPLPLADVPREAVAELLKTGHVHLHQAGKAEAQLQIADVVRDVFIILSQIQVYRRGAWSLDEAHAPQAAEVSYEVDAEGWSNLGEGLLTFGEMSRAVAYARQTFFVPTLARLLSEPESRALFNGMMRFDNIRKLYIGRALRRDEIESGAGHLTDTFTLGSGLLAIWRQTREPISAPELAEVMKLAAGLRREAMKEVRDGTGTMVFTDKEGFDLSVEPPPTLWLRMQCKRGWGNKYPWRGDQVVQRLRRRLPKDGGRVKPEARPHVRRTCPAIGVEKPPAGLLAQFEAEDPFFLVADLIFHVERLLGFPFGKPVAPTEPSANTVTQSE